MAKTLSKAASRDSDADLAQRVAEADPGAFELLMRRHNRTLFRTARAILRDEADAEDAVQEAYVQAYRAMGSFRGQARLSTWLARIAANEALMRLRKQTRRSNIVPLVPGVTDDEIDQTPDSGVKKDPEVEARRAEIRKLLEERIDALPEGYRDVFVLRAVDECPVQEVAAILGIPEATVRSRFFRARSLLREGLATEIDHAYGDVFAFGGLRCDRIVARVIARMAQEKRE